MHGFFFDDIIISSNKIFPDELVSVDLGKMSNHVTEDRTCRSLVDIMMCMALLQ